jgi:uncharacterized protein DUF2550
MVDVLTTSELVIGTCASALLLFLLLVFVRRRLIARSGDVFVAALREHAHEPWRMGLLRLSSDTLDWFTLIGLTPRPYARWVRGSLDLGHVVALADEAVDRQIISGALRVTFEGDEVTRGHGRAELAIAPAPYTAVRAWAEAAPPLDQPLGG